MDLEFSQEQEMLREMVRGVCAELAPMEVVRKFEDDPIGFPADYWKQLGELGRATRGPVPGGDGEPGAGQVGGHRGTHRAQSQEGDLLHVRHGTGRAQSAVGMPRGREIGAPGETRTHDL